jgi:hypothetical protein
MGGDVGCVLWEIAMIEYVHPVDTNKDYCIASDKGRVS